MGSYSSARARRPGVADDVVQDQLEQPDGPPLAHRVDAADDDRSGVVTARTLGQEPVDQRRDRDIADALFGDQLEERRQL